MDVQKRLLELADPGVDGIRPGIYQPVWDPDADGAFS